MEGRRHETDEKFCRGDGEFQILQKLKTAADVWTPCFISSVLDTASVSMWRPPPNVRTITHFSNLVA